MKIALVALCAFLVACGSADTSRCFEHERWSKRRFWSSKSSFDLLASAAELSGRYYPGDTFYGSCQVIAWLKIRRSRDALRAFERVFESAVSVEGKLYALAGIIQLDRDEYLRLRPLVPADKEMFIIQGDVLAPTHVQNALAYIESGDLQKSWRSRSFRTLPRDPSSGRPD
jgi:hypothetical protein